jgi:lipoprotein-releasing system permease protein
MRFELYVAFRYLKAKRKQTVISIITVISVLGVAAGVTALIVALSISAGFREDLQSKLLRGTAHINVTPVNPTDGIADYPTITRKIKQVDGVRSAMPAIYQNVLLSSGTRQYVVTLKGLATSESPFSSEDFFTVTHGDMRELSAAADDPVRDRLAIGADLAGKLGTFVGDFINVISAEGALSPFGYVPRQKRFKVVAIFSSGLYEFDSQWGFTSLASAQRLFGSGNLVSVIECRVRDIYQVRRISQEIEGVLGKGFVTLD